MRVLFLILVICITSIFGEEEEEEYLPSVYGAQILNITCDTETKFNLLKSYVGCQQYVYLSSSTKSNIPIIEVLIYANNLESFKSFLKTNNIKYNVFVEDVGKEIETSLDNLKNKRSKRSPDVNDDIFDSFPRYEEIKTYVMDVAKNYSDIVEYFTIGNSSEGREIFGVKISSNGENKPAILIDAGIHAREWIAPTTALYAIKLLTENTSNSYVYKNVDVYIIPLMNPDGYEYSHQSVFTRLWRKTRSQHGNSNCKGVDGNRNFDHEWGVFCSSNDPCSDIYAGPKAFSEPETAALRDFVLSLKNLKVYLSFHSADNAILYPWGTTTKKHPNAKELQCAADKAKAAISKVRGTDYTVGNTATIYYRASGGSDDWVIANTKADLSYTVELPSKVFGFEAPTSEIKPIGQETFEAIKVFAKYIKSKYCSKLYNRVCDLS